MLRLILPLVVGQDAAAIVAFLERVSTGPLPQNVRRSLEEWGALPERVIVHRGVPLLHAVDVPTFDALYADSRSRRCSAGVWLPRRP